MAHQWGRASSTGGQGSQLHLIATLQPRQLSSGQSRRGSVLVGEGGSLMCQQQGEAAPERPRSPRRRPRTPSEASQLPAWPGVERTAASAGGEVPQGCRSLASRGRVLRALVLLAPVCCSGVPPSGAGTAVALWDAPRRGWEGGEAGEGRGRNGPAPAPLGWGGRVGAPKVRLARRVRAASC